MLVVPMRPGVHRVRVESATFRSDPASVTVDRSGGEVTLRVRETRSIAGRVEAVPARHTLTWVPERGESKDVPIAKDRTFRCRLDRADRGALIAAPRYGRSPTLVHVVEFEGPNAWSGEPIVLAPRATPRLRVVAERATDLSGIDATLWLEGRSAWSARAERTGDDRRALTWSGVPPGRYLLTVRGWTSSLHRDWVELGEAGTAELQLAELVSDPTARVTGRLVAGGEPVGRVAVALQDAMGELCRTRVGASGRFEFECEPSASLDLVVLHDVDSDWNRRRDGGRSFEEARALARRPIGAVQADRELGDVDLPGGVLAGTLTLQDRRTDLRGCRLVARRVDADLPETTASAIHDGRWHVPFLAPGAYELEFAPGVETPGLSIAPLRVELEPGERRVDIDLVLEQR